MQRPRSVAHSISHRSTGNNSFSDNNSNRNTMASSSSSHGDGEGNMPMSNWLVNDDSLRDIPSFYPLEKSSKYVQDTPSQIANRISDCCRVMSVQACFDNDLATADLKTSELVEIHISLWKSPSTPAQPNTQIISDQTGSEHGEADANAKADKSIPITIVEAQRRKGDAVTYYKYCRNILSAADGSFSSEKFFQSNQNIASGNDTSSDASGSANTESQKRRLQLQVARQASSSIIQEIKHEQRQKQLQLQDGEENAASATASATAAASGAPNNNFLTEKEDSLLALEIAASLIRKDRKDCRQLGMETLCLLTDPLKSGIETALLASKVVLFGSINAGQTLNDDEDDEVYMPAEELGVREAIISLIQFGKLGEYIDFEEEEEENHNSHPEEKEFNALLHNLALAVLANALEVLEQYGQEMADVGTTTTNTAATAAAKPAAENTSTSATAFLQETKEISKKELLSTLLNVLGKAESKPHDACLSAQCLRSLFQASKKAKRKARDLNAKQIVNTALDVGRRTHVRLETETKKIIRQLERTDDMDDGNGRERANEENDLEHDDSYDSNSQNEDIEEEKDN